MQRRLPPPAARLRSWGMAALISGLLLAAYWPALRGGMVWDDDAHVTRPDLRSWAGLGRIWIDLHATQQYYPVLHSAFWVEHRLWGDVTLGYHLTNVALHAAACCLLALALCRLWGMHPAGAGPPAAVAGGGIPAGTEWLVAAIFAVHPVGVESVAWISEQKNTLSLVFYLLAARSYLDFWATRRRGSYAVAAGFFLLALGTKTVTATLPAALLVVLWWRNGRLTWRQDVRPLLPWFLAAAAAGLLTAWVERTLLGAEGVRFELGGLQRVLLAGRVIWFYLGKLAWPANLMFIYPRWDVAAAASAWYGYLAGALGVTAGLWALRTRARGPLAGWLFFVGSLVPALGFFNVYPFLYSYVADHFQNLASLGIITAVVAGGAGLLRRAPRGVRAGALGLCAAGVVVLAFQTRRQCGIYRDGMTLYRETLARNPDCWMAHSNLANELAKQPGRSAEALAHYERALAIQPGYAEIHYNLGAQLALLPGRENEAIAQFREALRLKPDYAAADNNLANLLARLPGREAEAPAFYETALRLKPDDAELHCNLAVVLARLPGRAAEARAHFEQALQIRPDYAEAHYSLANELSKLPGREAEALAHYEAALRIRPDFVEAHNNLAIELSRLPGREAGAMEHFQRALQLDPNLAEAHFNLAALLAARPGREADAAAHYREVLRLRPGDARAHNNLAIICARQGRFEEAREHWEKALELNPNYEVARRNLELLQQPQHL